MYDLHLGELAALTTAILWTVSSLAVVWTGRQVGSLAVSFFRLVVAVACMMIYGWLVHGLPVPLDVGGQVWWPLVVSGFLGFFLCDVCLFKAMLLIGPRLVLLVYSLTPPMAAVVSWAFLGDALTPWQWGAMGITLAGVAWVALEQPDGADSSHAPHHRWRGIALGVFAAATSAIAWVFSKEVMNTYHDGVAATLIRVIGSLPGYLVLLTVWRRWPAMLATVRRPRAVAALIFIGAVGPFLGSALSMVALRHAPTGVVTTILATMPVLILPLSILVHHEKVSLRAAGGALIAVAGVAVLLLWPAPP